MCRAADRTVIALQSRCGPRCGELLRLLRLLGAQLSRFLSSRRDLEATSFLEPFEVAQIGNMCPVDAQEAKALIPSLDMPERHIDNKDLTDLLTQVSSYQQFT